MPYKTICVVLFFTFDLIAFGVVSRSSKPNRETILEGFSRQYPEPVTLSPDGKKILLKIRHPNRFEIVVLDRRTQQRIASDTSPNTQLSLTWRPDSQAIVWVESEPQSCEFRLFELDLSHKRRVALNAPRTASALPPLRWSPNGKSLAYYVGNMQSGKILLVTEGDQRQGNLPVLVDNPYVRGDFAWIDNHTFVALSQDEGRSILKIDTKGNEFKSTPFPISNAERVRDLAPNPKENKVLFTVLFKGRSFFELAELDLKNGSVEEVAKAAGDMTHPRWNSQGTQYVYHVEASGMSQVYLAGAPHEPARQLGNQETFSQFIGFAGGREYLLETSLVNPTRLVSYSSKGENKPVIVYAPPKSVSGVAAKEERLAIAGKPTTPIWIWRSNRMSRNEPAAVVFVHGGPNLVQTPRWDAGFQSLLEHGIDVVAVNYRGSLGYGQNYERAATDNDRIEDILAACEYVKQVLRVAPARTILMGSSYGTSLVERVAALHPELTGGMVLVSSVPPFVKTNFSKPVFAFQGDRDCTNPPNDAHALIETALGSGVLTKPSNRWNVLENEGHMFQRTSSWVEIYGDVVDLLNENLSFAG